MAYAPLREAPPPEQNVEPEANYNHSAPSDRQRSKTASIGSSVMGFREENGRNYRAPQERKYVLSNDEKEQDRLDLQHHLFTLTFEGKLFTCGVDKKAGGINRVLDAGCGTGIWAIDFADQHPNCHVLGVDLSPIQPPLIPPNTHFRVNDLEEDWSFSFPFDFIYARGLTGGIRDFPAFFKKSYENLTPGGYIELADKCFPLRCDDGSLLPSSALQQWSNLVVECMEKEACPLSAAGNFKKQLEEAGFTGIVETRYAWPINHWPRDKKFKHIGMWAYENYGGSLEELSSALFGRHLRWKEEEVKSFLEEVRKDMKNTRIHAYVPIYVVSAQKRPQ